MNPLDFKKAGCEGKAKFTNQKAAEKSANKMQYQKDATVKPYKCNFCNAWHIGQVTHNDLEVFRDRKRRLVEELAWDFE